MQPEAKEPKLTGDAPKEELVDDAFGLETMVKALAKSIVKDVTADGYVIGIEGSWGAGKTTFVNFLEKEIKCTAPAHQVIRFEPWLLGEKNALLSLFFGQLAARIAQVKPNAGQCGIVSWWVSRRTKGLANKLRRYGEYIGTLSSPLSIGAGLDPSGTTASIALGLRATGAISKWLRPAKRSLDELKKSITVDLLRLKSDKADVRFDIIIDDTDRLEPGEALEILRLVRKVADFPLITYLVCFDREALSLQVKKGLRVKDGHQFIEKIFQNVISIPPQEPFALRRYLKRLLTETFPNEMNVVSDESSQLEYRKHLLFDVWGGALLKTPRDVMRVFEAVKLGWRHLPAGSDFADFVWLQLIKLKCFALYEWVRAYLSNVGAYRDGGRAGDMEPKREADKLSKLMEGLEWGQSPQYSGLGEFLPGVESFLLEGDKKRVFNFNSDKLSKFERDKRLGSPSHWRQYFTFDAPSYAVRDEDIARFREAIRGDRANAQQLLRTFASRPHAKSGHFLDTLLDRLLDVVDTFSNAEVSGMATAFVEVMDDVVAKSREIELQGHSDIWAKASLLLRQPAFDALLRGVNEGKSVNWVANTARDQGFALGLPEGHSPRPERQWLTKEQLEHLVEAIVGSCRKIGAREIFRKPYLAQILFCWLQLGKRDDVRDFVTNGIREDSAFFEFLDGISAWSRSSDEGVRYPLYKSIVANFVDADATKARLDVFASDDTEKDAKHREKAREFLSNWKEKGP